MDILLFIFMAVGIVLGIALKSPKPLGVLSKVQMVCLFILIFLMGFNIGNDKELIASIDTLGFSALIYAVISAACAFLLTTLIFAIKRRKNRS